MSRMEGLAQILQSSHDYLVIFESRGFLGWILIGLLAGWLAGKVSRGRGFGCVTNIILGLVGAVVGGWLFSRLGIVTWGFWGSLAAATVGSVVLVAIGRLFSGGGD